jgi:hypothetical protein
MQFSGDIEDISLALRYMAGIIGREGYLVTFTLNGFAFLTYYFHGNLPTDAGFPDLSHQDRG